MTNFQVLFQTMLKYKQHYAILLLKRFHLISYNNLWVSFRVKGQHFIQSKQYEVKVLLQRLHLNGSSIGFYPKTSKLDTAPINVLKVGVYVVMGTCKDKPPTPLARGSPPLISLNRKDIIMRKASFYSCHSSVKFSVLIHFLLYLCFEEAEWPSGHGAGLAIQRPRVQVSP